ncbi:RidA family protein [Actinopolymorpha sp. B17G11]|uniref:RidA family protein n=1 Tax=Actinopolymorpha sp. B17G11 TaxID=3160861 RepID=UPI0032E39EA0
MSIEQRIRDLGIDLPPATAPWANYANAVRTGDLLFISGKGPTPVNERPPKGRLGAEFSVEDGYRLARSAGLDLLAVIRTELGSLDRVAKVVEIQGFVNATPEFEEHPQVLDGCSDLLVEVFGDRGIHARSVFGATSLRAGFPVILKGVVEVSA